MKKRIIFTPDQGFFYSKFWLTGRLIALAVVGVASERYRGALYLFFVLAVYWALKLLIGLLRGKYTGIR